jgi:hypothetical protein
MHAREIAKLAHVHLKNFWARAAQLQVLSRQSSREPVHKGAALLFDRLHVALAISTVLCKR